MRNRRLAVITVLGVVVAMMTSTLARADAVEQDGLAKAQQSVVDAQVAADKAAARFDAMQVDIANLEGNIAASKERSREMQLERQRLRNVVRARAVTLYRSASGAPFDEYLASSKDALSVSRRAELLDHANAAGIEAEAKLKAKTQDLEAEQRVLERTLNEQRSTLERLDHEQKVLQDALRSAVRAQQELKARLERERRLQEYAARVRQAKEQARERAARGAAAASQNQSRRTVPVANVQPGVVKGGDWVCPIAGPVSFTDTWGAPRSGGRTHKGTDLFNAFGTPVVAVVSGSVFFQSDPLGGLAAYVTGGDGTTYYYAHLNDYVGGARTVAAGEVIAHNGSSGNADASAAHVHFEMRLGGPNGQKVNPYPTLRAHC